jgi:hypothetical protein
MWRSRHRLERAVCVFFKKNSSRDHFVAAIDAGYLYSPTDPRSRKIVVARYDKDESFILRIIICGFVFASGRSCISR